MRKLTAIFDFAASRALIFAGAFIWARYYIAVLAYALLAAGGITFAISLLWTLLLTPGRKKRTLSAEDARRAEETALQLTFMGHDAALKTFYNALKTKGGAVLLPDCILTDGDGETADDDGKTKGADCILTDDGKTKDDDCKTVNEEGGIKGGDERKTATFVRINARPFDTRDLAEVYAAAARYNAARIAVFADAVDPAAADLAARLADVTVTLYARAAAYAFLKDADALPPLTVKFKKHARMPIKRLLSYALHRRRARGYLFGAATVLIGSLFVRYNVYYLAAASVMLLLALLCFINFRFKQTIQT